MSRHPNPSETLDRPQQIAPLPRAGEGTWVRAGAGDDAPTALRRGDRWLAVVELLDRYRTDDRWWTAEPIARTYYELLLENGRAVAVFHDDVRDAWYEQRYG